MDMNSLANFHPTFTYTLPKLNEPNINGTMITREVWDDAMRKFEESSADEAQADLVRALRHIAEGRYDSSDAEVINDYIYERIHRDLVRAFNAEHQAPIMTFRNSMEVSFNNNQQPEYEKGIEVGDNSSMDAFLDEFLIHGA